VDHIPERRAPERPRLTPPPKPPKPKPTRRPWALALLLVAVPVSLWSWWQGLAPSTVFLSAAIAVVPLAMLMGKATAHLAERSGPTIGGLLNATFGNAAELIIALVALRAGYVDLVKATITGSILGNLLLILGLSLFVGGLRHPLITFNRTSAGMSAAMLALAVAGLVFPALFHMAHPDAPGNGELWLSEAVSVVLLISYAASLIFVLRTHRPLFGGGGHGHVVGTVWGPGKAIGVLALATAGVALESELLVHGLESATQAWGITPVFLGLIALPMIGNAAEHATAVVAAGKGQSDLALQIALGSSTQVALLIAPVVVWAGAAMGGGMNLVFTPFEVIALALAVGVSSLITLDGESHWFEGVQLLALYALIGAAAWLI
jgi:Ca2+:H+ antiporter